MIFGFNTDVRHADTVYHVQSEAQQGDTRLQTHIFVGGHCLGHCDLSVADSLLQSLQPDVQDVLRLQHRQVLECIRQGQIDALLAPANLLLEWLEASAQPDGGLALFFRVSASGIPLGSAYLAGRLDAASHDPSFASAEATDEGRAELHFAVRREAIDNSSLLVEAVHAGRKVSGRFLLHTRQQVPALTVAPTF